MKLRQALATDRDAIAKVWRLSTGLPGVGPVDMPPLREFRAWVDQELADGWEVTVAVEDHEIVAFLAIKKREHIVDQLFVRPGAIGSGFGRALLEAAKQAMPAGFTLFTRAGNERARRFYERSGLHHVRDGVHPHYGDPIVYYAWSPWRAGGQ